MPTKTESLFCCPLCKGVLTVSSGAPSSSSGGASSGFACGVCGREYPEIAGIVDFRICEDPYIDIPADRAKALRIAGKADALTFEQLVAFYYSITPEVPDDLGRHYLNHHVAGVKRGEGILNRMQSYQLSKQAMPGVDLLDLGCGTGGFLAAASAKGASCVGADIALRWLVIARSRFRDLNCRDITLVCACADHLPFAENSFDAILAENLLEHCRDTTSVLAEVKRISRKSGAFLARTINRYAMGPEPHVGVWGVGYLPRSLMNGYVKLVKGIPYEHIHLESFGSLNRAIEAVCGSQNRSAEAICGSPNQSTASIDSADAVTRCQLATKVPLITEADYAHHPKWKQCLFKLYTAMMRMPILGASMAHLGPYIDIVSPPVSEAKTINPVQNKNAIYN
ncbi:MAG: class I SAM-dependent methyltransferase [Cyanobacteria bacterium SZAS-4]|nr:class I SAM-dependent methyltransferase [Cyanobacteria bacterium SZAS-4]